MTVKDLETAISRLSHAELAEFAAWFAEYEATAWDRQIAEDARAGRLDSSMREADDEYRAGWCPAL
jgi:hypothetical protein